MTITPTEQPVQVAIADPAELLIKEARENARRRHMLSVSTFSVLVAVCLVAIGIVHFTSSPTKTNS